MEEIYRIVDDFMYEYASNILDSGHSSSGNMVLKMNKKIYWKNSHFIISIVLPDYWKYLEEGTKPHFPPVEKIREWIRVKPILPRPKNGKLPTENQLAYLIGRKISKVGTEGTHLLRETKNEFNIVGKIYNAFCEYYMQNINKDIAEYTK